jgi:anti-sigma factor RsiW
MTTTKKPGRPKSARPHTRINVRLTADDYDSIAVASSRDKVSPMEWMRSVALAEAKRRAAERNMVPRYTTVIPQALAILAFNGALPPGHLFDAVREHGHAVVSTMTSAEFYNALVTDGLVELHRVKGGRAATVTPRGLLFILNAEVRR